MRLSDLVARLSDYSLNSDLITKDKSSVLSILNDVYAICNPLVEKNKNSLECSIDKNEDIFIYCNSSSIIQVLLNIVMNSNKHTKGGYIVISVKSDEDFAMFTIEDIGTGIDEAILPHIFKKGISGDKSSGLGLSISKEIIEQNSGHLNLDFTDKTGTNFTFTVPLWKED